LLLVTMFIPLKKQENSADKKGTADE